MSSPDGCTATAELRDEELERLEALPDTAFHPDTQVKECEFTTTHGPEVMHAIFQQSQDVMSDAPLTSWWLRWSEDGRRELTVEPACGKRHDGEECLLVAGHPGDCDTGYTDDDEEL